MIFILLKGVVWVNLNVFNLFTTIGYLLFKKNTNVYYYEQYYNEQSLNSGGFVYFCGVNF